MNTRSLSRRIIHLDDCYRRGSALIAPASSPQIDLPDILDPLLGNITSQELKQEPFDIVDTLIAADPFA